VRFLTRGAPIAAAVAVVPLSVSAAPCGASDLISTFPPDGARAVAKNATLSALYAPTAEYDGELISLAHADGETEMLTGSFDSAEGLLSATPSDLLIEGDEYVVTWPGLRSSVEGGHGAGAEVSFTASGVIDAEPPTFDGLSGVEWDIDRARDECTDSLEDRFTFDLGLGKASDDGGRASLALVVYQTRGPGISEHDPPVQVSITPIPEKGQPVRVERSVDDATGLVCFAAMTRDLTGAVSGGADQNVCTTTVPPPFFYGCGVPRGGGNAPPLSCRSTLAILATSLVVRRIRRLRPFRER
jgi:hypothetical protein